MNAIPRERPFACDPGRAPAPPASGGAAAQGAEAGRTKWRPRRLHARPAATGRRGRAVPVPPSSLSRSPLLHHRRRCHAVPRPVIDVAVAQSPAPSPSSLSRSPPPRHRRGCRAVPRRTVVPDVVARPTSCCAIAGGPVLLRHPGARLLCVAPAPPERTKAPPGKTGLSGGWARRGKRALGMPAGTQGTKPFSIRSPDQQRGRPGGSPPSKRIFGTGCAAVTAAM